MELAESAFRKARLRVQRENIGLAQHPNGTLLVRVGAALPGEIAAWRYGREFVRRRRKYIVGAGVGTASVVGFAVLSQVGAIASAAIAGLGLWGAMRARWISDYRQVVYRTLSQSDAGRQASIRRWHVDAMSVRLNECRDLQVVVRDNSVELPDFGSVEAWISSIWGTIDLARSEDALILSGKEAHALLRRAMVHVNGAGAGARDLRGAVDRLENAGSADAFLLAAARDGFDLGPRVSESPDEVGRVNALAFEMALNEESERNALHGELAGLMQAWREAEEIASIADGLFDQNVMT